MGFLNRGSERLGIYNAQNIDADTSYYGECGALRIACDAVENDRVMFEAMLENDFAEMDAYTQLQEGAITESEIEAIQEASIGGVWAKIKEIVKKIASKIKGLFQSFIVKVNSVIIRDNKKFVEKYKRDVLTKDTSKMKYKWSEPHLLDQKLTSVNDEILRIIDDVRNADDPKLKKLDEELSDGTFADEVLKEVVKNTDEDSFDKDYHEACFDDEEEVEGLDNSRKSNIIGILTTSAKCLKEIEDANKATDKAFTKYLNFIDKISKELSKTINGSDDPEGYSNSQRGGLGKTINLNPDEDLRKEKGYISYGGKEKTKEGKTLMMNKVTLIQRMVTKSQGLYSKVGAAAIAATKFEIAQARRVFAKAAAYNPKSVKESAVFESAAEEAAYYDVMSSFESPEMA